MFARTNKITNTKGGIGDTTTVTSTHRPHSVATRT
jgi:hypothetical protein